MTIAYCEHLILPIHHYFHLKGIPLTLITFNNIHKWPTMESREYMFTGHQDFLLLVLWQYKMSMYKVQVVASTWILIGQMSKNEREIRGSIYIILMTAHAPFVTPPAKAHLVRDISHQA